MAKMAELAAQGITNLYDYNEGVKDGIARALEELAKNYGPELSKAVAEEIAEQ